MQWYNEPANWHTEDNRITVTADAKTDFWRKTHNGQIRDNGHFYFQTVRGDFECSVVVRGDYNALYDQAGLMVRVDEQTWLKCGIEYVEGVQYASAVVTRDTSDWSVAPLVPPPDALWLRVTHHDATCEVAYALDGKSYTLLRQAYLTGSQQVQVGVMCAAPEGNGFDVTFDGFTIVSSPSTAEEADRADH